MSDSSQYRTYNRNDCITFRKTSETFGGLSNMAGGYPLRINGIQILTSEALYQACRFPHLPEIQKLIISQRSPMTAKMKSKPYRSQSRSDWDKIRVNIMRWCLRVKLMQNWEKFGQLLLSTGNKAIVEDSRKDKFWGAIPNDELTLTGINVLGRLLMELRELLKQDPDSLKCLKPLNIDNFYFLDKPIEEISLDSSQKNNDLFANKHQLILQGLSNSPQKAETDKDKKLPVETESLNNSDLSAIESNISDQLNNQNKFLSSNQNNTNDLFYHNLPIIEEMLSTEKTKRELVESLKNVRQSQVQDWLDQAIEIGRVKKIQPNKRRAAKYISISQFKEDLPLLDYISSSSNH